IHDQLLSRRRARAERHDLPAHADDLLSCRIEIDLAVEAVQKAISARAVWLNANAHDRNDARAEPERGHRVAAGVAIEGIAVASERMCGHECVAARALT